MAIKTFTYACNSIGLYVIKVTKTGPVLPHFHAPSSGELFVGHTILCNPEHKILCWLIMFTLTVWSMSHSDLKIQLFLSSIILSHQLLCIDHLKLLPCNYTVISCNLPTFFKYRACFNSTSYNQ